MMLARVICLSAFTAVAGIQLMPSTAEAGLRLCFPFLVCNKPPNDNYDRRYEGEEPEYMAPKRKTTKAAPQAKPSVAVEKKAVSSTGKKTARATPAMSCVKAEQIVSDYGFANITPTTCTGQVFAFNATRSGKNYVIKLNSASGELTEVNKVQ